MTKHFIFIFILLCSLQLHASVQHIQKDSVQYAVHYESMELLQPLRPVYLDGVVLPVSRSGNWFVSIAGGVTAFLGMPLGCEDIFGRLKSSYSFAVGKWFTPSVGARINYSGLQFKDGALSTQEYHHIHADLLWNVLGRRYARQEQVRWGLVPFVGVGLLHHATNGHNPFAVSYGVQGQYRISKRVSAVLELSNTTTFRDFDGYGRANRLGDHMLSLTAGFTFHLGKVGWKRAVDAMPYIRRNEQLVDYANYLAEDNRRYAGLYDRDRRILVELKKILEIEGLLDTYSHLFEDDTNRTKYPVNNYSGLNSLRARLKHRHWDGTSPLDSATIQSGSENPILQRISIRSRSDFAMDSTLYSYTDSKCIGAPIYFFFALNSTRLTDASQALNLDELARVAKKFNLSVRVTGAADSMTGTADINQSLSVSRAGFIVSELERRGIPVQRIVQIYRGGISDHTPAEANRYTKAELYISEVTETSE